MFICLIRREFSALQRLFKVETRHFSGFTPGLSDYGALLIKNRIVLSTTFTSTIFPSRNFPNFTRLFKNTSSIQYISSLSESHSTLHDISIMETKDRDLKVNSRDVAARVQELIQTNTIMVFSKSYCPFCRRVKELFEKELQVPYRAIELDQDSQGSAIMDYLKSLTGQKTVPNVFINGQHIGGCDSTYEAHRQGQIRPLLASAMAGATTPATAVTTTSTGELLSIIFYCVNKMLTVVYPIFGVSLDSGEMATTRTPGEMPTSGSEKAPIQGMASDKPSTETISSPVVAQPASPYDYDLVVIGGGSGGIACAREGKFFIHNIGVISKMSTR